MGGFFVAPWPLNTIRSAMGLIPPSAFGHSPRRGGEKICCSNGFSSPLRGAERKETARGAVLAKEPACRAVREAPEGFSSQSQAGAGKVGGQNR